MYRSTAEDEAKRVQFFKDLDSAVDQIKSKNAATVHDLNIIKDFEMKNATLSGMKSQLKYSEEITLRLRDRLVEIKNSDLHNVDRVQQSKREIERVTRSPSDITKPNKESFDNFIKGYINESNLNDVIQHRFDERKELITRIESSYDRNITEPALTKIYSAVGKKDITQVQAQALSYFARGESRGIVDPVFMRDANDNQMRNYQNMHIDLSEMHRRYPTNVHTERLAQEASADIKNPVINKVNSDELAERLEAKVKSLKSAQVISVHDERSFSAFTRGELTIDNLKSSISISTNNQKFFKQDIDRFNTINLSDKEKRENISKLLDEYTKSPSLLPPAFKQEVNSYISGKSTYENMSNTLENIRKVRAENIDKIYNNINDHVKSNALNNGHDNKPIENLLTAVDSATNKEMQAIKNFSEGKISDDEAKVELQDFSKRVVEAVAENYGGDKTKSLASEREVAKPATSQSVSNEPKPGSVAKVEGPQPAPSNSIKNSNTPSM